MGGCWICVDVCISTHAMCLLFYSLSFSTGAIMIMNQAKLEDISLPSDPNEALQACAKSYMGMRDLGMFFSLSIL